MKRLHRTTLAAVLLSALAPLSAQAQGSPAPAPAVPTAAAASDREDLERLRQTLVDIVTALGQAGALPKDKAEELLKKAQTPTAAAASDEPRLPGQRRSREPVRVQYVPPTVLREMREQIRQEIVAQARSERWGEPQALPDWVERIRFEGDVRFRAQQDMFAATNAPAAVLYNDAFVAGAGGAPAITGTNYSDLTNSSVDRTRLRVRARLGATARLTEEWGAGVRLSTGSIVGPVSTSSTAGDPSDRFGVKLDRAFVRWQPAPWLAVNAGRFANPFFSTELLYAPDLGFDGVAVSGRPQFGTDWQGLATVGVFPLRENSLGKDRWLYGAQLGGEWRPNPRTGLRLAYARYVYSGEEGSSDTANFGGPAYALTEYERGFRQKGNTLFRINNAVGDTSSARWGLASSFDVEALTASLTLAHFDPMQINLTTEYTRNRGFDAAAVSARTGALVSAGTSGYLTRLTLGAASVVNRHDWQAQLTFRRMGKDGTLDAFTDPDFGLGGTNLKGYVLGFTYGLERNVSLGSRWLSARQVEGPRFAVDTFQVDVNVRF